MDAGCSPRHRYNKWETVNASLFGNKMSNLILLTFNDIEAWIEGRKIKGKDNLVDIQWTIQAGYSLLGSCGPQSWVQLAVGCQYCTHSISVARCVCGLCTVYCVELQTSHRQSFHNHREGPYICEPTRLSLMTFCVSVSISRLLTVG